jgi:hypothetical protein
VSSDLIDDIIENPDEYYANVHNPEFRQVQYEGSSTTITNADCLERAPALGRGPFAATGNGGLSEAAS